MMFRIAPASLAVLAIFNVAPTLADDDFKVYYAVLPFDARFEVISDPRFAYGGSGCGSGNDKCQCTLSVGGEKVGKDTAIAGQLLMKGQGSSNTATGLDFYCFFTVGGSTCSVHIDIPLVGTNHLTCVCAGYTFYGCDIPSSGHDFTKTIGLGITICPADDLQLDKPRCPAGCVSVNARQRRQLLFGSIGAKCPEGCVPA